MRGHLWIFSNEIQKPSTPIPAGADVCIMDAKSRILGSGTYHPGSLIIIRLHAFGEAVPLDRELVHDLPAMAKAVGERTKLVLVCNPNNPTGTSVGSEAFDRFAAALPDDVVLVVDEAYVEYAQRKDAVDAVAWMGRRPGTLALRTFSRP